MVLSALNLCARQLGAQGEECDQADAVERIAVLNRRILDHLQRQD